MALSSKAKQQLKAKAHHLKPVVMIGSQGLTDAVKKEMDRALTDHELIKVRMAGADREARQAMVKELSESLSSEVVQQIGLVVVLYRKNAEVS